MSRLIASSVRPQLSVDAVVLNALGRPSVGYDNAGPFSIVVAAGKIIACCTGWSTQKL